MKSPLRYPGGKSRVAKKLVELFPKDIECYCEPFLGGGSVLLEVLGRYDCNAVAIDRDENLIYFWKTITLDPFPTVVKLLEIRKKDIPVIKKLANSIKSEIASGNRVEAWAFYLLNRCSFAGSMSKGGLSPSLDRFTERQILSLRGYQDLYGIGLECDDFMENYDRYDYADFMFVDPPYYNIKGLYKHEEIDHTKLRDILAGSDSKWLLTLNDCNEVRELYKDFKIDTMDMVYGMSKNKRQTELIIRNY